MKKYLETLITEKNKHLDDVIDIDGHYGVTYQMLVDFIDRHPTFHKQIRNTIVQIDFKNGDVFHYLHHLATGMCNSI